MRMRITNAIVALLIPNLLFGARAPNQSGSPDRGALIKAQATAASEQGDRLLLRLTRWADSESTSRQPKDHAGQNSATQDHCMNPDRLAPEYYVHPSEVDLIHILAPPPAIDSFQGKADLQAVLDAQRARTPAQVESARADACLSIIRFADVMGPGFKAANLPLTIIFFEHVFSDDQHSIQPAKKYFNRPRPFVTDPRVSAIVERQNNPSYPSGHATFAYVAAILLADMVPERAPQIFERAATYADGRVIGGVHYPSDLEAGRISASVIDNALLHNPRALADLAQSKVEVRTAMGLC